jgi:hypothetical protein
MVKKERSGKRMLLKGLMGILAVGMIPAAFADVELGLTDSGNFSSGDYIIISSTGTVVASHGSVNLLGGSSDGSGEVSYNGKVGAYNVNVSTGQGSPDQPIATLDLDSVDTASKAPSGALDVFFSETSVAPAFDQFDLTFGGTLSSGKNATISNTAYESNTNAFFATTQTVGTLGPYTVLDTNPGNTSPIAFSGSLTGNLSGVAAPYSLTEEVSINGKGVTTYSGDSTLSPVPEPASVVLFGGVLLGCTGLLRRKFASNS